MAGVHWMSIPIAGKPSTSFSVAPSKWVLKMTVSIAVFFLISYCCADICPSYAFLALCVF